MLLTRLSCGLRCEMPFEKGKAAIAVGSLDKLPGVIDALIKAVRAGELDEQLNLTSKFGRPIPPRKVA